MSHMYIQLGINIGGLNVGDFSKISNDQSLFLANNYFILCGS